MASRSQSVAEAEKRNISIAKTLGDLCEDKRAQDVQVLDMRPVCNFTDAFIIATATSGPQLKGLSRDIEKQMREKKVKQLAKNGIEEGVWVVLDYGDIVVHLQTPDARMFYRLEELWGDAPRLQW